MRVLSYKHSHWGSVNPGATQYGYSVAPLPNSNLQSASETTTVGTTTWQYTYDNLNRLSTAVNSGLQTGCQENYDNWGNRYAQQPFGGAGYGCTANNFTPPKSNNQVSSSCYDAMGNVVDDGPCPSGAHQYAYDAEGRMTSSGYGATVYVYGADGARVTKQIAGGTFHFVTDLDGSVLQQYQDNSYYGQYQYAKLLGHHLATITNTGTLASTDITWAAGDWVGSERVRFDMAGNIRASFTSLPFGDGLTTTSGNGGGDPTHFTAKERDTESNLDYFGARYYASNMARFTSPDPGWFLATDLSNPQSWNQYAYVLNNPLSFIDPAGLFPIAHCTAGTTDTPGVQTQSFDVGGNPSNPSVTETTNASVIGHPSYCDLVDDGTTPLLNQIPQRKSPSNIFLAPSKPSLAHIAACAIAAPVLGLASASNRTVGVGVGGSAGIGVILGLFGSIGVQVVADPQGNAGLAFNVNSGGFGGGIGAQGGGQISISTARTISALSGGPAGNIGGSVWIIGADISHTPGGSTTGTLTIGPGVGGDGGSLTGGYSGIAASTNCKDLFH